MAPKDYPDPGPMPEGADEKTRRAWRKAKELFDTEGFRPLPPPSEVRTIDPKDHRLQALRRNADVHKFLEIHDPAKASIWLALLRPAKENFHAVAQLEKFDEAQRNGTRSDGSAEQASIVALGQRLVVNALRGDNNAVSQVIDRIEGKAGLRAGDEAEDDPAKRKQAQDMAERIIRKLVGDRTTTEARVVEAKVIDVTIDERVGEVDKSSKDDKVPE